MKKLLLGLWFSLALLGQALAVSGGTSVGDTAYTILNTDVRLYTTTTFTVGRTWTLPYAAGTCIGQSCGATSLEINDLGNAFSQQFQLTLAPQSGDTINGNSGNLIISGAGARLSIVPTSGSNWQVTVWGDYQTSGTCAGPASTATVTITIAAPGVFTDTAHGITGACPVVFTNSGGGLPTGITSGTTYWVVPSSITTNTYTVATTVTNALAGTAVTTTGSSTGTQTRTSGSTLSTTAAADITGLSLSQGLWECRAKASRTLGASTSVTKAVGYISATTATAATVGTTGSTVLSTAANVMGAGGTDSTIGPDRISLTATTNRFMGAQDTFTVSTNIAYGTLTCDRVR